MARNTSIILGDHFEAFITNEIASGKYSSASEVIRAALRLLQQEESMKKALVQALIEGENSGFEEPFDPAEHLRKLHFNTK